MASHAFIVSWLMSPGNSANFGVNWSAGTQVWSQKGIFNGDPINGAGSFSIKGCSNHSVSWEPCGEEELGGTSRYDGPDVYIWWKNKISNMVMGGFLDHWTLDRPRSRGFGNISEGWKMSAAQIYNQAGAVRIGLQGKNGSKLSNWYELK